MKFRKLRIAWSVAWGAVAVLLCALWVRNYWSGDVYLHWFGIALNSALATASWFKWSPRFRLHTLLIATTLVAAVLWVDEGRGKPLQLGHQSNVVTLGRQFRHISGALEGHLHSA